MKLTENQKKYFNGADRLGKLSRRKGNYSIKLGWWKAYRKICADIDKGNWEGAQVRYAGEEWLVQDFINFMEDDYREIGMERITRTNLAYLLEGAYLGNG